MIDEQSRIHPDDEAVAALLLQFPDTHAVGLQAAQGLTASETFFWDLDDATRAWTKRFLAATSESRQA